VVVAEAVAVSSEAPRAAKSKRDLNNMMPMKIDTGN
jgi:hypothetical protein